MNVLIAAPHVWERIMGPVQMHMTRRYESVIAARLQAQRTSTAAAGPIAAALAAMLMYLSQESLQQGELVKTAGLAQTIAVFRGLLGAPDESSHKKGKGG